MRFTEYFPWSEDKETFLTIIETLVDYSKMYNQPLTWHKAYNIYRKYRTKQSNHYRYLYNNLESMFIIQLHRIENANPHINFRTLWYMCEQYFHSEPKNPSFHSEAKNPSLENITIVT